MIQTCETSFSSYSGLHEMSTEYITQNGNMLEQHEVE